VKPHKICDQRFYSCWVHGLAIEVKAVVLQTKPQVIEFGGKTETLTVDKFQPASPSVEEYVETVSRLIAGNHIQKARTRLLSTVKDLGAGKKMAAIAVNLFAAPFFPGCANLEEVVARLRGKRSPGKLTTWQGSTHWLFLLTTFICFDRSRTTAAKAVAHPRCAEPEGGWGPAFVLSVNPSIPISRTDCLKLGRTGRNHASKSRIGELK